MVSINFHHCAPLLATYDYCLTTQNELTLISFCALTGINHQKESLDDISLLVSKSLNKSLHEDKNIDGATSNDIEGGEKEPTIEGSRSKVDMNA